MDKHMPKFIPNLVDNQLDQLLARRLPASPNEQIVSDLHQMYQGDERSLMKVWQRLGLENEQPEKLSATFAAPQPASAKILNLERNRHMHETRKNPLVRTLSLLAAACVAALIVGSMLVVSNLAHQSQQHTHTTGLGSNGHQTSSLPQGIYVSNIKGLTRVNSQTHQAFWQQSLADIGKIVPAGNVVYVLQSNQSTNGTNAVVALNANTGKILWTHAFSSTQGESNTTDMVLAQNQLYVGWQVWLAANKSKAYVSVLNTSDGKQHAVYSTTSATWTLAVSDGILAVSADTGLQVYDPTSGKSLWHVTIKGPTNSPVISLRIVNNLVYILVSTNNDTVGEGQSYIAAYKVDGGALVWKSPVFAGDALLRFAVDQNIVYFGTAHLTTTQSNWTGKVYAYDVQNNKQLWSLPVNGAVQSTPVISDGLVYVNTDNDTQGHGRVIAISAATGAIKWQQPFANGFVDNLCVSNGIVYFTNPAEKQNVPNKVYALNAANGNKLWEDAEFNTTPLSPSQPEPGIGVTPTE
ncbi:MAG TPA: PQQ-binding-like beta-propeller repeat protein [Ktedonobacteraceae bacterium]